jgi:hypothetical protein
LHDPGRLACERNRFAFAPLENHHDRIQPDEFASEMIRKIDYFSFFSPPFSVMRVKQKEVKEGHANGWKSGRKQTHRRKPGSSKSPIADHRKLEAILHLMQIGGRILQQSVPAVRKRPRKSSKTTLS